MSVFRKNWEVGSTWYSEPSFNHKQITSLPLFRGNTRKVFSLMSTCRSAIDYILSYIEKSGTALVPAFTCHSVVSPFLNRGYEVHGYPVNYDLTINWTALNTMVEELSPSVVLIHGYFGLNNICDGTSYIKYLKEKGITVIEDMTQNMFSTFPDIDADFNVGSIRKWGPIPDGAFLSDLTVPKFEEDIELTVAKTSAMLAKQKYIYDDVGIKNEFMPKFSEAEEILDSRCRPYAISQASKTFLQSVDWEEFLSRRRGNYELMSLRLSSHPQIRVIKSKLSIQEVPFLLPVLIENNRSDFQKYMAVHNVYPTIIWKCPEVFETTIDPISKKIYDTILCFHIDQRYDKEDMKRVADIVDSYFG